jgi:hypothetical protein
MFDIEIVFLSIKQFYCRCVLRIRKKNQNRLFSLGMLTYTYERQDIIQIALKRQDTIYMFYFEIILLHILLCNWFPRSEIIFSTRQ